MKLKAPYIRYRFLVLLAFCMVFAGGLSAQVNMNMYTKALIVNRDSISKVVYIRNVSDDKMSKSITVLSDDSLSTVKIKAEDLISVKIGDDMYVSKPYEKKKYLMRVVIDGAASLYELSIRERKGNKSEINTYYFAQKKDQDNLVPVEKKTFKTTMADFVKDYTDLSVKIQDKFYTYTEKEAVIEEYNEWIKQGKPGKTWTPQDGNFTRPDKDYTQSSTQTQTRVKKQFEQSRWGIDIPLMATYCFATYPDALNYAGVTIKNGGFGYNVGAGARFSMTPSLLLRFGLNFRNKGFNAYYVGQYQTTGHSGQDSTIYINVNETGQLHYFGMYLMAQYESRSLILGGGLDFGFASIYRADYRLSEQNGTPLDPNMFAIDHSKSTLSPNGFNAQVDLTFNFGYKINIAQDLVRLKPVFQYSIPLITMFDLPFSNGQSFGASGYLVQIGIITDIGFKKKTPIVPVNGLN